jgi:hypothetical protein
MNKINKPKTNMFKARATANLGFTMKRIESLFKLHMWRITQGGTGVATSAGKG